MSCAHFYETHKCVQVYYTEFYGNRTVSLESTDRNLCTPQREAWLSFTSIFAKLRIARYMFVEVCNTECFPSGMKPARIKANFINAPKNVQLSPHQVLRHSQLLNDIKYRTLPGSPKK